MKLGNSDSASHPVVMKPPDKEALGLLLIGKWTDEAGGRGKGWSGLGTKDPRPTHGTLRFERLVVGRSHLRLEGERKGNQLSQNAAFPVQQEEEKEDRGGSSISLRREREREREWKGEWEEGDATR